MRLRIAPWRHIVILALLAVGLFGASAVGNAFGPVDEFEEDNSAPSEPVGIPPYPARSLAVVCNLDRRDSVTLECAYSLTVRRADPIIGIWRDGDLDSNDLLSSLLAQYNSVTDTSTVLTYSQNRPLATLTFTASFGATISNSDTVMFDTTSGPDEPADTDLLVTRQTWTIRAKEGVITRASPPTPRLLTAHELVTSYDPLTAKSALSITVKLEKPLSDDEDLPARPELPQAYGDEANILGDVYWTFALLLPWIAVAVATRRSRRIEGKLANAVAVGVTTLISIASGWFAIGTDFDGWPEPGSPLFWVLPSTNSPGGPAALGALTFIALPVTLSAVLSGAGARPRVSRWLTPAVAVVALIAAVFEFHRAAADPEMALRIAPLLGGTAAVLFAAAALPFAVAVRYTSIANASVRRLALPAVALGLAVAAGSLALNVIDSQQEPTSPSNLLAAVTGGALLAPVAIACARLLGAAGRGWRIAAIVLAVTSVLPPIALVVAPMQTLSDALNLSDEYAVGPFGVVLLELVLLACAFAVLRTAGQTSAALRDPLVWAAALAVVASLTAGPNAASVGDLAVPVSALALFILWFRGHLAAGPLRLVASVTATDHVALLRAALRRRLVLASAQDLYRAARAKLAAGEVEVTRYDVAQDRLDDIVARGDVRLGSAVAGLDQAALGSHAGVRPWRSGMAAAGYALVIAAPIIVLDLWAVATNVALASINGVALLATLCYVLRWLAYGFLFGYFYPIVRGVNPAGKARSLLVTVLVPEVLQVMTNAVTRGDSEAAILPWLPFAHPVTASTAVLGIAVRAGQVIAFCIALGLCWERRLCVAAGVTWSRLRNFRSLRSLGAPTIAVVVAAVTTAATALATVAVGSVIATSPAPEPSKSSPAPTPTATR
jgi:hypothetical protein